MACKQLKLHHASFMLVFWIFQSSFFVDHLLVPGPGSCYSEALTNNCFKKQCFYHFHTTCLFQYPFETYGNIWFSDVSGVQKETKVGSRLNFLGNACFHCNPFNWNCENVSNIYLRQLLIGRLLLLLLSLFLLLLLTLYLKLEKFT